MRVSTLFICLFLTAATAIQSANASISIVATVNNEPVTNYDVEQRMKFLRMATNLTVDDSNRDRLAADALQMLIDDKLKIQAAVAIRPNIEGIAVPKAREIIDSSFGSQSNAGMKALRDKGLDPLTVQSKYVADLVWADFLKSTYTEKFEAIEGKIDKEIERLTKNASQPQYFLSEIVLTPSPNRSLQQTIELAKEMVEASRKGADFAAIAEQYSAAGTASNGGRLGWVVAQRMPEVFRTPIAEMENGGVTDPVELDGAVYIFRREGYREKGMADASQARVWLARALLFLPNDATNPDRLEAAARIERDSAPLDKCDDLVALHESYGSDAVAQLDEMMVGDLAPQMQKLVAELEQNVVSAPLAFAEGVAVFMVCRKEAPSLNLPTRDEIRQRQTDTLFGTLSERHLLRLRRAAVIDYRN